MIDIDFLPVFIIGAPRSGTYLLSKSLANNIDCQNINEINDFWKSQHPFIKTDFIPVSKCTPKLINKTRKYFNNLCRKSNKKILIEKTAANCLRLDYINRIFPEALYIHIYRNGIDASVSIKRKYYGDIRKITQYSQEKLTIRNRISHIIKVVENKVSYGFHPLLLIRNFNRYLSQILRELRIRKRALWGPIYPGFKYLSKHLNDSQLAAKQWEYCIHSIMSFLFSMRTDRFYEIKYLNPYPSSYSPLDGDDLTPIKI